MKDKLRKAIRNNCGLYEAVFGSRGIGFRSTDDVWYSTAETPPLYSNLITLSESWKPDDVFRGIDLNYEKEGWEKWSIKDSFAALDLRGAGFKRLFDARWLYLEAARFKPAGEGRRLRYEILNGEDALSAWRAAWDSDESLGRMIFDARLLRDPRVHFVAGYGERGIESGCLINRTDDVLGVSNFFSPGERVAHWSDIVGFVFDAVEPADLVGYERLAAAGELRALGFESVGNLTVWVKREVLRVTSVS
jgi:hypothetical protein